MGTDRNDYDAREHERVKEVIRLIAVRLIVALLVIVGLPVACEVHSINHPAPVAETVCK